MKRIRTKIKEKTKAGERVKEIFRENWFWLAFLLLTDAVCALFLWLLDAEAFLVLAGLLAFSSAAFFFGAILFLCRREEKREHLYQEFLDDPDELHARQASEAASPREQRQIRAVQDMINGDRMALSAEIGRRTDYEEYIETWAHEIKTPLSLLTLMLDSRSKEMSETVRSRLDCAQIQIQEYVEQMLYYSRVRAEHKDYVFERLQLSECCHEVLDEYRLFLSVYGFQVEEAYTEIPVLTDRKNFAFILRQVFANAVKYRKQDGTLPRLSLKAFPVEKDGVCLSVADNGIGVMRQDLPFLFDRGFCSETGENGRKSTGMGLYLVKQLADDLKIRVEIRSEYGKGFEIRFYFPELATISRLPDSYISME